ncbi:MAG: hypothetical protein ABJO02_00485 [Reichenbachiella sp.]|uniref:hypothetical protein n=1 Tax=Reichenbachiella sp. TaxID=2184521 RepID=UPI0032970487
MNTHADKTQKNKSQSVANAVSQKKSNAGSTFQYVDNRPEVIAQRKLQEKAGKYSQTLNVYQFQSSVENKGETAPIQLMKYDPNEKAGSLMKSGMLANVLRKAECSFTNTEFSKWKKGEALPVLDRINSSQWEALEAQWKLDTKATEQDRMGFHSARITATERKEPTVRDQSSPHANFAFRTVRGIIGTPINHGHFKDEGETPPQKKATKQATGELYNMVKLMMGLSKDDKEKHSKEEIDKLAWVLKSAAIGAAMGAGVCNNVAALTAIILTKLGAEDVKYKSNPSHNFTQYGKEEQTSVDPWKKSEHVTGGVDSSEETTVLNLSKFDKEYVWGMYKNYERRAIEIKNWLLRDKKYSGYQGSEAEKRSGPLASPRLDLKKPITKA